jgi:hypothetical protein
LKSIIILSILLTTLLVSINQIHQTNAITVEPGHIIGVPYGSINFLNEQSSTLYNYYPNSTIYFDVSGKEISQGFYHFTVTSYGNGSMTIRFKGIQPTVASTNGRSSYKSQGAEDVLYVQNNRLITDDLCIVYVGNCGNGPNGGGTGTNAKNPPGVSQYFGPNYFPYQLGIVIAILALIFIGGLVRRRQQKQRTR